MIQTNKPKNISDKKFNEIINLIEDYFCGVEALKFNGKINKETSREIFFNIRDFYEVQDYKFKEEN